MAPTVHTPPINTYVPLESIVLTNAASSVTFFNIAQSDANGTYKDLVLIVRGTGSGTNTTLNMRFNGDTGSNYSRVFMQGTGSAAQSAAETTSTLSAGYVPSSGDFSLIAQLLDHSATDKHKSCLFRSDVANSLTWAEAGRWASTSAISLIQMYLGSGSFSAGTTFSLYALHG